MQDRAIDHWHALTPERRALFEALLHKQGMRLSDLPIPRLPEAEPAPLSHAQERFWLLHQLAPESPAYNEAVALRLRGPLDVAALERSLSEILRRHTVLRSVCRIGAAGRPEQAVLPDAACPLPVEPLDEGDPEEREARARALAEEEARRPFDLERGPLLRARLIRLAPDDHLLVRVTHHFVVDGYSERLFLQELGTLYRAYADGQPPPLPEPELQYRDYAAWERAVVEAGEQDEQVAYWRRQLAEAPDVLELPTDRPRPDTPIFRGATLEFALDAELSERIRAFSGKAGVTPFMTLLAAYQTLLHRYSGQNDILVGTPVSNRPRAELESVIGSFANNLVLRSDFAADPSFRDLVRRVSDTALDAFAHQDAPFERVLEAVQAPRHPNVNPLFQASFLLHRDTLADNLDLGPVTADVVHLEKGTGRFDLDLMMMDGRDGYRGWLEYDSDLFDAATVARFTDHFRTLLAAAVADPDTPVSRLDLLTAAERERLLATWNDTAHPLPKGGVHQLIEAQADRTPDAVAVIAGDERVSYAELDRRANRLAHHLRGRSVAPGDLVGVCLNRSVDMLASLLAIWKVGATYLPLDPDFPGERLRFMLEDAGAAALVTETALADRLPSDAAPIAVRLDAERDAIAQASAERPEAPADPHRWAYVIYTSGSTGRPKGVTVPHRGVVNFLTAMAREPGLSADDRLLAVTTLSFDIAVLELYLPLTVGAATVIVSRDVAADGAQLLDALRSNGATVMQATPATWRMLLAAGWTRTPGFRALCGGEALPRDLARELLARSDEVWNLYGPTETTVWSTRERLTDPDAPIRIGRPIENTRVYVVDRHGQPVPVGVPGELWIGGAGVADGYLSRPELTNERFVPDPWSDDPNARLYRTGDLARYREDGRLECLGRMDHQVKLRGFRIELGEVEAALGDHPKVREAVAVVREDRPGDQRLVAYVVPDADGAAGSELRRHLRERLPDYMIPQHVLELAQLPLTPNGKVDRKALPEPFVVSGAPETDNPAPDTDTERYLADLWRDVLGVERIGVHDTFFDLGGHSLLATQVVARVRRETGARLTPMGLVMHGLRELAEDIDRQHADRPGDMAGTGWLHRLKGVLGVGRSA